MGVCVGVGVVVGVGEVPGFEEELGVGLMLSLGDTLGAGDSSAMAGDTDTDKPRTMSTAMALRILCCYQTTPPALSIA